MNYAPLLALFIRSLREDARSRATYWARAGLGCFLLIVLFLFAANNRWNNAPGREFFTVVISFQIAAITLLGLSYFASAVAEEKEEQTLGLLRMTDLSPLSILLGKSTSRLWGALCLLAAQLPFTIIAVTFGGISLGQVVASYCAVGAFAFLLCNLALLGSVISRGVAGAAAFSLVVIGLLLAMVPLLHSLQWLAVSYLHWKVSFDRVADGIWAATPIARLSEVLGTGYKGGAFGWQFGTNLAFGVVCFLLAWAAFQRFCDREPEVASSPVRVAGSTPAGGTVDTGGTRLRKGRPPRAWARALVWKDFHYLFGGRLGFIIRAAAYGATLAYDVWELIADGRASSNFGIAALTYRLMPFVFSIDVGLMAARMFRTELRDQTFSALAVLPGTMRDLVRQKVLACLFAAAPGLVCCVALQVIFLFFQGNRLMGNLGMPVLLAVSAISSWLSTLFLVVLIAWLSLHMKRGALPAGFLLSYVGSGFLTVLIWTVAGAVGLAFTSGNRLSYLQWSPLLGSLLGLVAAWVFYLSGLQRLQVLAGED